MSARAAKRRRRAKITSFTRDGASGDLVKGARMCGCYLVDTRHPETDACREQEKAFRAWWAEQWGA